MGQEGRRRVVAKFSQKVMARNISAIFADVTKSRR
jgi:glycosyltransferase involved in cell wall biosynthesis